MNLKHKYPPITAIINTHNSPKVVELIGRALESVLAQELDVPWEVMVVNDGPASKELIEAVAPYEDKFNAKRGVQLSQVGFFFATDDVSGYQCRPKNIATWHSRGEYIAYLDYDNEWMPNHLQVLWDAMNEGEVWPDFTYGRREYVVDEGCKGTTKVDGKDVELPTGPSPFVEWNQKNVAFLLGSCMNNFVDTSDFLIAKGALWRVSEATNLGMWNEGYRRFGDWELIARGAGYAGFRGKAVDEVITKYYWTGENMQLTRKVNEVPQKEVI